jgi:hypothetical protein
MHLTAQYAELLCASGFQFVLLVSLLLKGVYAVELLA